MDFGGWVLEQRKKRHLDVRSFAKLCDTDASTISRIENERSSVTLLTAYKICAGLHVSIDQVLADLGISLRQPTGQISYSLLKHSHLQQFVFILKEDKLRGYDLLADLLTLVAAAYFAPKSRRVEFEGTELKKLFLGGRLYRFSFIYPPISKVSLETICKFDGVISRNDIGPYLSNISDELPSRTPASKEILAFHKKVLGLQIGHIKLADILDVVTDLSGDGVLIKLLWKSIESYILVNSYRVLIPQRVSGISAREVERLTYGLMTVYRWVDYLQLSADDWLAKLEQAVTN